MPSATTTGAGRGRLLQPGGQVRRLADHRLLPGRALADEVAHDHEAGRDPDPRRERLPGRGGEPGDGLDDRQAGPHGALGLVLVRPGPAEVGQHAVAHELGDVPVEARDLARDRVLVGAQDLAHLLRVEPAESAVEPTRSTNITVSCRRSACGGRCRGRAASAFAGAAAEGAGAVAQGGDRVEQLAAVAERQTPSSFRSLGGQLGQDLGVDRRCRGTPARTAPGPSPAARPRCPRRAPPLVRGASN